MKEYKLILPESGDIKQFPNGILLEEKPSVGEFLLIQDKDGNEYTFRVREIYHRPTILNTYYNQFHKPIELLIEFVETN